MPQQIEQNPDVRPARVLERSGVKTLIILIGGTVVERVIAYLTGIEAPWAPYAAAVARALWDVFRGPPSYRPSTQAGAPSVVVRP